ADEREFTRIRKQFNSESSRLLFLSAVIRVHPRLVLIFALCLCVSVANSFLRKYSAHARRFGHAIDRQDVSACAHVCAVTVRRLMHLLKRVGHSVFERLINALLAPEER